MIVPLPLAIAGGILAGCVAFLWSKRPVYYEVRQGPSPLKTPPSSQSVPSKALFLPPNLSEFWYQGLQRRRLRGGDSTVQKGGC